MVNYKNIYKVNPYLCSLKLTGKPERKDGENPRTCKSFWVLKKILFLIFHLILFDLSTKIFYDFYQLHTIFLSQFCEHVLILIIVKRACPGVQKCQWHPPFHQGPTVALFSIFLLFLFFKGILCLPNVHSNPYYTIVLRYLHKVNKFYLKICEGVLYIYPKKGDPSRKYTYLTISVFYRLYRWNDCCCLLILENMINSYSLASPVQS